MGPSKAAQTDNSGVSACFLPVVKQSGGYIWVYSEPGQGTTFKIYLPAVEGETVQVQKKQISADLTGSETILIVEDDDALRNLGREILELQGYKILDAENGIEALKVSEEYEDQIHLMITDAEWEWGSYQAKRLIRQDKPEKWWSFLTLECPFWG